jgi:alkylation response protein AidB-like acyl-CoA dehydrogenase
MDIEFSKEDLAFRDEVRAWVEANLPRDIRDKMDLGQPLEKDDFVRWQKILFQKGWAAPDWPVEYGGTGWSLTRRYIFDDELGRAGAPPVMAFGLKMVGPVIYTFGNAEQKRRFLPDILASNVWWSQGYSEPGAGSDLAGLSTRAERDGDHYVVNGIKAWTTLGQYGDWIFCLLLIDMKSPGVSVHPVITMEGDHEVNETHFENVRVPVENRIGDENKGWTYAKYLLTHERTNVANIGGLKRSHAGLRRAAEQTPVRGKRLLDDATFARKLAEIEVDIRALEATVLRTLAQVATGGAPGPESSLLKIKATDIQQALTELSMEIAGNYAHARIAEGQPGVGPAFAARAAANYFNTRKVSIYGGSNEIQRNIIVKAVLGL